MTIDKLERLGRNLVIPLMSVILFIIASHGTSFIEYIFIAVFFSGCIPYLWINYYKSPDERLFNLKIQTYDKLTEKLINK